MMSSKKAAILKKLDKIAKPSNEWLKEAQFRVDNQDWLKHSQMIALKILRELRAQGKSQLDLATALNVKPQQVNRWVKGSENFTLETIAKIEGALNINLISNKNSLEEKKVSMKVDWSQKYSSVSVKITQYQEISKKGRIIKMNRQSEWSPNVNYPY